MGAMRRASVYSSTSWSTACVSSLKTRLIHSEAKQKRPPRGKWVNRVLSPNIPIFSVAASIEGTPALPFQILLKASRPSQLPKAVKPPAWACPF
jgi:hypothetical protein